MWTYSSCMCKNFLPAYSSAEITKLTELSPQIYCHVFMGHSVDVNGVICLGDIKVMTLWLWYLYLCLVLNFHKSQELLLHTYSVQQSLRTAVLCIAGLCGCTMREIVVVFFVASDTCSTIRCCTVLSTSQEIGWEERLRNDLVCVEWDVQVYSMSVEPLFSWH